MGRASRSGVFVAALVVAALVVAALVVAALAGEGAATADPPKAPVEVWLRGKAGRLQAWLWRPAGPGPFPALVYNHGSEPEPMVGTGSQIGTFFVAHGYAVLFPYRRGTGKSEGRYWQDGLDKLTDDAQWEQAMIARLVEDNDDVITAIEWMRAQPWVARDDISVGGCSFGGIETLLTAERPVPGLRAALDFAGASASWADSPFLRERLLRAVEAARVPIFFLQAENDYDTAPSQILSAAMRAKKLPSRVRIFDRFGGGSHEAGHSAFCNMGWDYWGNDLLDFQRHQRKPAATASAPTRR
jgi:dienelactone hydrolase